MPADNTTSLTPEQERKARAALGDATSSAPAPIRIASPPATKPTPKPVVTTPSSTPMVTTPSPKPPVTTTIVTTPAAVPTPATPAVTAPAPGSKEARLAQLLDDYKAGKITPAVYQEQRAKIRAEQ
jgi:hypothetical protein